MIWCTARLKSSSAPPEVEFERNLHDREMPVAQLRRVDDGGVALYQSRFLQPPNPLGAGRVGQVDPRRKLDDRQATVALELVQNAPVDSVQFPAHPVIFPKIYQYSGKITLMIPN